MIFLFREQGGALIDDIRIICEQILRQIKSPMKRRNDSNLLVIKSQVESIMQNDLPHEEKFRLCKQLVRQLDVPMRRSDDWNLGIVKEHVLRIINKLNEGQL
jgi:hypothetical protein